MRVALYARVSTEEQALHGLSIEAQKAALGEWAANHTIVDYYIDLGVSARKPILKRPELQRLLKDVEAGKVDLIAFVKLDRWTRNVREYYKAQDILDAHNVAWRAIHEDYETETAAGRLKTNIMLAVAQDEADRTSERVKAVFAEKRRKGLAVTGHVPPGIQCENGVLSPSPDAPKVKTFFERYVAVRSVNQTCRESLSILGKAYSIRGTRQLLTNERYLDVGVVSPELWNTAQTILKQRQTRTPTVKNVYLFSGLVFCPVCGHRLTARTVTARGVKYSYYRCDDALRMGKCSWRGSVREDRLEEYLRSHLLSVVKNQNVRITQKQKKSVDASALQRKLTRLTDLYIEGGIEKDEFDRRAEPLRDAINAAKTAPKPTDTAKVMSALDAYTDLQKSSKKAFWSVLLKSVTPKDASNFDVVLL